MSKTKFDDLEDEGWIYTISFTWQMEKIASYFPNLRNCLSLIGFNLKF
jgi:hypothetical protein